MRTVREVLGSARDVTGELAAGRYAVLHASTGRPERLVERCSASVERLRERHGADERCGIGEPGRSVAGTHDSYRDAPLALRAGTRLEPGRRVFAAAELRETLVAWAECGFQLVRTADRLAIHPDHAAVPADEDRGAHGPRGAGCGSRGRRWRCTWPDRSTPFNNRFVPTHR
ncbi:hypothetical protein QQM39_06015 [Streptomyces sp. DT2A-34]|uniref:hypothetical protein n=1 Tax=Streptomyces sp. DT2A-34 TaxID=3051182 RepID=UPI00265C3BB1|nr:hypothetical protein [Streptomyces sp. DT2A-34]MDO0910425.1 hypothetical protein [Streptomyces sp. DT2A-34]